MKMKTGIPLAGVFFTYKGKEHPPKNGDMRSIVVKSNAVLYQSADRAVVVSVKVVMMVLRDSQKACDHKRHDNGLYPFHESITLSIFPHGG